MDARAYLERIGYDGPLEADAGTLAGLQRAHLLTVPFDTLDCHLGNRVTVEPADAFAKVVERRRGGFCFELNGLFAWLLEELGYDVTRLAARPLLGDGSELAPPRAHLVLLVALERRWLADVGFGFPWALEPLDADERDEQSSGGRRYRVRDAGNGDLVAEELGAEEPRGYRFALEALRQTDFAERCEQFATSPRSPFVVNGPVQQLTGGGWVSVTRTTLREESADGSRRKELAGEDAWRAALRERFGYEVDGRAVTVR